MTVNRVAVVDYGMGNLRSVTQAVIHAASSVDHAEVTVTNDPQVVRDAHRVVLPGQGAMPDCMRELRESGLLDAVLEVRPASRCLACAWACRCCSTTAPRATRPAWA